MESLVATIRAYDDEDGDIIKILYNGENINLSNGEDTGLGKFNSRDEANAATWFAWGHWKTFNWNESPE